ncbi:serine/threonine-protein kinase ATM, partial [Corchorus olitorius]
MDCVLSTPCSFYFVSLLKESSLLNDRMVLLLPAAVYALCAGSEPFTQYYKEILPLNSFVDATEVADDWIK